MCVRLPITFGALALISCTPAKAPVTPHETTCQTTLDAGDIFSSERIEGTFVLRDDATGCTQTTNAVMADEGVRPQSTFLRSLAGADVEAETARLTPLRKSITRTLLVTTRVLPGA